MAGAERSDFITLKCQEIHSYQTSMGDRATHSVASPSMRRVGLHAYSLYAHATARTIA